MKTGYIKIEENSNNEFIVKVKLDNGNNGNLWLTEYEIARLFNVYDITIRNNLRSIFKSGLLREQDVACSHSFHQNGKDYISVLYNLEAIIFLSYMIASFEAEAFRKWLRTAIIDNLERQQHSAADLLQISTVFSLN